MNIDALVASMTPDIYAKLLQAVETGKWLDGTPLNDAQRESSMQAVMLYQSKILQTDQHMTVGKDGEIVHKSRQQLKNELAQQDSIARFTKNDF